jgi:hypothetical protein
MSFAINGAHMIVARAPVRGDRSIAISPIHSCISIISAMLRPFDIDGTGREVNGLSGTGIEVSGISGRGGEHGAISGIGGTSGAIVGLGFETGGIVGIGE